MNISEKIKYLRILNNFTQKQFAILMGVDRSMISSYETGRRELTISRLLQISKIFHVKPVYFLDAEVEGLIFYADNLDVKTYQKLNIVYTNSKNK